MASHRLPSIATLATAWCDQLNQYCTGLQKSCTSLHAIVQRKPEQESKGDNSDIFLEDLNDDVSSALAELQHLEERTTDTLSFAELLVHCGALYESNEDGIRKLELQLQQYGYTPVEVSKGTHEGVVEDTPHEDVETDSQNGVEETSTPRSGAALCSTDDCDASVVTPIARSNEIMTDKKGVEYSPLFGDLGDLGNLESLGISATSLTALAGQDEPGQGSGSNIPPQHSLTFAESPARDDSKISSKWRMAEEEDNVTTKYGNDWNSEPEMELPPPPSVPILRFGSTYENDDRHLGPDITGKSESEYAFGTTIPGATSTAFKKDGSVQSLESMKVALLDEVTSAQYDNSPSFLKLQVSLQELNSAVTKINGLIMQRSVGGHHANQLVLDQDDVQALGLGSKAKACFLLLGKADKLVTRMSNGVATYRIRA